MPHDAMPEPLRHNADLLPSIAELTRGPGVTGETETTLYVPGGEPASHADDAAGPELDAAASADAVPPSTRDKLLSVARPTLYAISLMAVLISLAPFIDRSGKAIISPLEVGSRINQIFFPLLLLAMVLASRSQDLRVLSSFARWPSVAFLLWLIPATVFSLDPALSARRTIFFLIQIAIAGLAMLLPRSERQLAWLLTGVAIVVIAFSYGGVVFAPELSIHQPTDIIETELAGNWRGIFRHKNEAGAVMVVLVFLGLYVMRALNVAIGVAIAMSAAVFLGFSVSKSSIILLPVTLALCFLVERCRTLRGRAFVAISLLVAFNVATLGSAFPGPVRSTLQRVMPDVTFTGRTDLWRFAMEHVAKRPLVGYGIGAFWRTGETMYKDREEAEPEDQSGWVAELGTDSHNGYLDVAVTTGLPGIFFLILAIVVWPLRDLHVALAEPANRNLARFYMRCWLFTLYLSSVESLLMPLNPIWYIMLQCVFGLLLLSRYRLETARA